MKSVYRIVIIGWPDVYVDGGVFFPAPTRAWVDGASIGGRCLWKGWIAVGFRMEIRCEGRRIVTSPVLAVVTERPDSLWP